MTPFDVRKFPVMIQSWTRYAGQLYFWFYDYRVLLSGKLVKKESEKPLPYSKIRSYDVVSSS